MDNKDNMSNKVNIEDKKDVKKIKIAVILFAALYFLFGFLNFYYGSDESSRYYAFDDILVRTSGLLLVFSSIGLLLRWELGRKLIIIALALSLIEIYVGIPYDFNLTEFVAGVTILMALYLPGLFYFLKPETKAYFKDR